MVFQEYPFRDLLVPWVVFHSKSNVCSSTPFSIFGPLIIFRNSITKTQILSKASLWIFHDTNHYKNNQNDKKQVNWSHLNINFISRLFFGPLMVIFQCHSIKKTLILNMNWHAYGMILMTVKTLETTDSRILRYHPSNYFSLHAAWVISNNQESIFDLIWRCFCQPTSPNL